MYSPRVKTGAFVLEALNSLAATYYFYYLFFFMQARFGFGSLGNLCLGASNGFVYIFAAWLGGRFAQKYGYFRALKLGFSIMAVTLAVGSQLNSVGGQFLVLLTCTVGVCLTWPTLEAIVSEHEPRARLQRMVGIYNIVWAAANAVAYFTGGAILERFGYEAIFWVPIALLVIQLGIVFWLEREVGVPPSVPATPEPDLAVHDLSERLRSPVSPKTFLRMAWVANPFAYVAIYAAIPLIPELANRFGLSATMAGVACSIWFFSRTIAFVALSQWPGWHYRFRWLASAYILMVICLGLMLLVPNLAVLVVAQLGFGLALGLIYYSSLFYSMDVGDTKGEHGGLHEAAIGCGIFAGPAVGAATLYLAPSRPNSGVLAVCAFLLLGLLALFYLRFSEKSILGPSASARPTPQPTDL